MNPDFEPAIGLVIDNSTNLYVTGWFDGVNDFGGVSLTNRSAGGQDIFVAKYDSAGNLQWARQAGGATPVWNQGRGIGVDSGGGVYVTGGFQGDADFGGNVVSAPSELQFFLAKYNSAGDVQWVRQSSGGVGVYGTGLAVDSAGNSYAVGYADNGASITFGTTNLLNPSFSGYSIFLVKYDNAGALQWAQLIGGSDDAYATKVAVDSTGNVYVRGGFKQDLVIGNRTLSASGPEEEMFIAKFDNGGHLIWVQQAQGGNVDEGGVAVDQSGNVYISGAFESNVNFGGITLTNVGSLDAFIAKYDSSGTIQWARRAAGTGLDFYLDVALDAQGNVYPAGVLSADAVAPSGSGGAMVAKYDPTGTPQWAYSGSGASADPIASLVAKIAVDPAGNCYLAGWYQTATTFGTSVLPPQGLWNFFLTKLGDGTLAPPTPPTITSQPQSQTVTVGANVNLTVTATGTEPLSYQWQRDGINISEARSLTYTILTVGMDQAGSYTVVVSNAGGSVTSSPPAVLMVNPANGTVVAWGDNSNGQTNVPAGLSGVTAIAGGYHHTVALKSDGTVVAWGAGKRSTGSDPEFGQSLVPFGLSGVTAIAAGRNHSVALKNDGTVVAWGYNFYGQTRVPVGLSGVTAIAAGDRHTVALKSDGTMVAWGDNTFGQSNVQSGLDGVVAIAAGGNLTLALKSDGTVRARGDSTFGLTTFPAGLSGVTAIAAGDDFAVALKADGTVVAWGDFRSGQTTVPDLLHGVIAIAAGGFHTLALRSDGTLRVWGSNIYGQSRLPVGMNGINAIAAGGFHTVALVGAGPPIITSQPRSQTATANLGQSVTLTSTAMGAMPLSYQWQRDGTNISSATNTTYRLLGVGMDEAGSYSVVVSNAAGSVTSAPPAVLSVNPALPGTVAAWGAFSGQIPAGLSGVTAISAGDTHTVALKSDGTVVAWGGEDSFGRTNVPTGLNGVTAITASASHTVALKNDGTVVAWGNNSYGQTNTPADLTGVTRIAAGYRHTVALKSDGTVVAWGAGKTTGSFGNYGQSLVPTGLNGVTAIAAGETHTVALKSDGTVVAWGNNFSGQTNVPTGLNGVTAIAAGGYHTVALRSDGTVVAWGVGGTSSPTNVPAGLNGVEAIAAGRLHTVALKTDGTVVAWGDNAGGQTAVPAGLREVTAISGGSFCTVAVIGSGTIAAPAITARAAASGLTLLWPATPTPAYRLESTLSLLPPVIWSTVTGSFQNNANSVSIILPTTGEQKFFRLVSP